MAISPELQRAAAVQHQQRKLLRGMKPLSNIGGRGTYMRKAMEKNGNAPLLREKLGTDSSQQKQGEEGAKDSGAQPGDQNQKKGVLKRAQELLTRQEQQDKANEAVVAAGAIEQEQENEKKKGFDGALQFVMIFAMRDFVFWSTFLLALIVWPLLFVFTVFLDALFYMGQTKTNKQFLKDAFRSNPWLYWLLPGNHMIVLIILMLQRRNPLLQKTPGAGAANAVSSVTPGTNQSAQQPS